MEFLYSFVSSNKEPAILTAPQHSYATYNKMKTQTHTDTYVGLYNMGIFKILLTERYLQVNSARTFVEFVVNYVEKQNSTLLALCNISVQ
jgi:hypothetical protein